MTESGSIETYFCTVDDCREVLQNFTTASTRCAFYDYDPALNLSGDLYIYADNHKGRGGKLFSDGLMHNKFCVRDGAVLTGSMNPTLTGTGQNYNNLVRVNATRFVVNYKRELAELQRGSEEETARTLFQIDDVGVEQYFCPEDACEERVADELRSANESIVFMTFMFTSDDLANVISNKAEDVQVVGVMDSFGLGPHSVYDELQQRGVPVLLERSERVMHHKVFIIDGDTVVTGSYNPTRSGSTRNDENIVVIHDETVAKEFLREFERVAEDLKQGSRH